MAPGLIILRGNIVIFPIYQTDLGGQISAAAYTANTVAAYKRAIDTLLAHKNWPQPMAGKLLMIGHSYGGTIATNIAGNYASYQMTKPLAFMPVAPGTDNPNDVLPTTFDPSIYMLPIIEEDDNVVGPTYGRALFNAAANVPFSHRNLVLQSPDNYGSIGLTAVHGECWGVDAFYDNGINTVNVAFANANSAINTVDYYCFWKLFDALEDCALSGNGCTTVFGNTAAQKNMGVWSDGTPVVPLTVTNQ
jgi:pimeloyl-ACP methyl ester carboxylesterase